MQLPFLPAGILLALAVLGGTFVLFGLALKALDWTIDASRDAALVGIVSGLRDWRMTAELDAATARPTPVAIPAGPVAMPAGPIEETVEPAQALQRVVSDHTIGRRNS